MTTSVVLTQDALDDLDEIHAYIAAHDGIEQADRVLGHIRDVLSRLSAFPQRGEHPPELVTLGIREYRQVHYKTYRMVYQLRAKTAYVFLIADGRRDMQELLQRRLLG